MDKHEKRSTRWLRKFDKNSPHVPLPVIIVLTAFSMCLPFQLYHSARFWRVWAVAILVIAYSLYKLWREYDSHCPKGCRKIDPASNLTDEFDDKYASAADPSEWKVKSLLIFPVKSCRAVELDCSKVMSTGMRYDRQFSFAQLLPSTPSSRAALGNDRSFWSFLTQREQPRLARVRVELWLPDASVKGYSPCLPDVQSEGAIIVFYPHLVIEADKEKQYGEKRFKIPFNPTSQWIADNNCTWEPMKIWKDYPTALNMGSIIPQAFRDFLGIKRPLGLFRANPHNHREVHRCAPRKEDLGYQPITDFADAYPLHILNVASVQDLSANLNYELPQLSVHRFRPNIVISGPKAYAEDEWKRIRIGGCEYHVSCRTVRCKMPNVHEETGEKHPLEPDFTLRKTRDVDEGAKSFGCLGMQAVPAREWGEMKVGDRVEVLERGEHRYIML